MRRSDFTSILSKGVLVSLLIQATSNVFAIPAHREGANCHYDGQGASTIQQNPGSNEAAMQQGNPQRSRVFSTKGVESTPQIIWKSQKLFQYRAFHTTEATSGPFRFLIDIPTDEQITIPIVSQGVIYFTFYVENAYFYAIDAETGKELLTLKFPKNALSAPAALGKTVFLGDRNGSVRAINISERTEKWTFAQKGLSFSYSAPVIDEGIVYFYGAPTGLYAFDAANGGIKWIFKSTDFLYGPAIKGDALVLVNPKGLMMSLDKRTGTKKWEMKIDREAFGPSILDRQIFLHFKNGEIRAYALDDGSFKWKSKAYGGSRSTPVLFNGTVIYAGRENSLGAIDAATGLEKWKFRTTSICHDPIVAGELLYATCEDEKLYAIDPATGRERWRFDNKKSTPPPPVVADGVMYLLGIDGFLYAMK